MAENQKSKYSLSLEGSGLSKRWPSWLMFAGILVLFLILPLLSLISPTTSKILRDSPLPSDNAWISGTLSVAHQIPDLNKNCDACHVEAFAMVQDDSCLSCHTDAFQHFDYLDHNVHEFDNVRCASCHREHEQPSDIVRKDDRLCVGCHGDMANTGAINTQLRDVDGFGHEQKGGELENPHPTIRISMLVPDGKADNTQWTSLRLDLSSKPLEQSNLKFPHDVHLSPDGIESPQEGDVVLQCVNCHTADDAGKLMQSISMETHCRSCHTMVFDEEDPSREVPHGDPDIVVLTLEEYYARQFLLNKLGRKPTPKEVQNFMLRRPGKSVQRRIDRARDLSTPWGKAMSVAQEIFENTTCKTCHEVSIDESGKYLSRWRVNPIQLTDNWMPKSTFDHYSHKTFDCTGCHQATTSTNSSDVLMPNIENCEACHTGVKTHESKLPTNCIACHGFHLPNQAQWGESHLDKLVTEKIEYELGE